MGTRHLIEVKNNNEIKISQYGQWDGYPTGQGNTIARFLHEQMDKEKFKSCLANCSFMSKEELQQFNDENRGKDWPTSHPWLSRDAGAKILAMVQDGADKLVSDFDFRKDTLMCEYAYLIDMDNETVTVDGKRCGSHTFPFSEWTTERMDSLEKSDDEEDAA